MGFVKNMGPETSERKTFKIETKNIEPRALEWEEPHRSGSLSYQYVFRCIFLHHVYMPNSPQNKIL
jgi:hypothetical protein